MIAAVIWAVALQILQSKVASTAATDAGVAAAFPAVNTNSTPTSDDPFLAACIQGIQPDL